MTPRCREAVRFSAAGKAASDKQRIEQHGQHQGDLHRQRRRVARAPWRRPGERDARGLVQGEQQLVGRLEAQLDRALRPAARGGPAGMGTSGCRRLGRWRAHAGAGRLEGLDLAVGQAAGQRLIERDAQGEQVGTGPGVRAAPPWSCHCSGYDVSRRAGVQLSRAATLAAGLRAAPRSSTRQWPSSPRCRLAGLISRCTTPLAVQAAQCA